MDDSEFESKQGQGLSLLQNPQTVSEARQSSCSLDTVVLARGYSGRIAKFIIQLNQTPSLRMSVAVPPQPYMRSWAQSATTVPF
jgi:hypothetical protein